MIPTLDQAKLQITLNGYIFINGWNLYSKRVSNGYQNINIDSLEDGYNKLVNNYYAMNLAPTKVDGVIYRALENFILAFTDSGVICNSQNQKEKLFIESRINTPFGFETGKLRLRNTRLETTDNSMSLYLNTDEPVFVTNYLDEEFVSWFSWLLTTPYKSLFTHAGYTNQFVRTRVSFMQNHLSSNIGYRLFAVKLNPYDFRLLIGLIAFYEYRYLNQDKDGFTFKGHSLI